MKNIAFTGGGTGGHIYPGLAVADELIKKWSVLKKQEMRLFWIGSSSGIDSGIVKDAGIEFYGIPSGKLRRYFTFKNFTDIFKIIAAFFAARKILKREKACILFSKGGFVSVPPCAAAASLGIPVFTHESDFSPGLATRINTRFVRKTGGKIFAAYEDTSDFFKEKIRPYVEVCGNPVRNIFRSADAAKGREFLGVKEDARILLVLGGSQGAVQVNDLIRESLPALNETYTVVHQTGPAQKWEIPASEKYKPFPYIKDEMPHVMAAAEIIAGRSGAGIWEWAVCGKPMVLIPLCGSGTRGDQVENARYFEKKGAALVLCGEDANAGNLVKTILQISHNKELRENMAFNSLMIGKKNAAVFIADSITERVNELFGN